MLTVTLGTAKRIHFKQIISLTCPQDCLKIFSKCLSALQKLSTVLIYKQMLRIERCMFLPSLMFWVCGGVCVVSCSSIHNFPLICLLRPPFLFIFFFTHRISAVWQSQYCSIDLGRGSCDNPVPGWSPRCLGAAPSRGQASPPARGSHLKRRKKKKKKLLFSVLLWRGKGLPRLNKPSEYLAS